MAAAVTVQNPHDHPLALLYQGEECWSFSEFLASTVFDGEDVHRIEASSLSDAMQVGMGKHFRHRNDDYLLVATWESEGQGKEAFIAVNHLFHDISSVSALLHLTTRYSNRKCRPQHCIKRVPLPCESRAMKPIKKTKLHFPWGSLREEANLLGFSANEYLFYKCSVAISRALREEFDFTCLHSSRKEQAVDRQAFGDYSCYARSLRVTQEIERQPDAVSSYFGRLRSGEYVLREDDSSLLGDSSGWWVFDTWLHSDVVAVRPGVVLNTSALMFSSIGLLSPSTTTKVLMFLFFRIGLSCSYSVSSYTPSYSQSLLSSLTVVHLVITNSMQPDSRLGD